MRTLAQWLERQESVHVRSIDLGLERVAVVAHALDIARPPYRVITVAGTNGKGSTVAYLEALLLAHGVRTGSLTSPHLLRYNERVRVQSEESSDEELIRAFDRIEAARGETTLTFFEYNTLAALLVFAERRVEVAVLEVGLGGRLDATNLVDADVAVLCSVGFDHRDWLGDTLDAIGAEKAGIFRSGRPAVLGTPEMPASVYGAAQRLAARLIIAERDFHWTLDAPRPDAPRPDAPRPDAPRPDAPRPDAPRPDAPRPDAPAADVRRSSGSSAAPESSGAGQSSDPPPYVWTYRGLRRPLEGLPPPALAGTIQIRNAATALAACEALPDAPPLDARRVGDALRGVRLAGRFQIMRLPVGRGAAGADDGVEWILDVSHNEPAAQVLADNLRALQPAGRTYAVCSILRDKDVEAIGRTVAPVLDEWIVCGMGGARGSTAGELATRLAASVQRPRLAESVAEGCALARSQARAGERVVVFGSFTTVTAALEWLGEDGRALGHA